MVNIVEDWEEMEQYARGLNPEEILTHDALTKPNATVIG
jgi:hypothetical protein